jgi:hypothetical protein
MAESLGVNTPRPVWKLSALAQVSPNMTTSDPDRGYRPPDPTLIEDKPEALAYWARTLETDEAKIRRALAKVGPVLDTVKRELGIGGVG